MDIISRVVNNNSKGIRFSVQDQKSQELGRAYLYVMYNYLHDQPFALIEDVYINEKVRGRGLGKNLIKSMINVAKRENCYKIIATSRYSKSKVHKFYLFLGFADYGKEFRLDLD